MKFSTQLVTIGAFALALSVTAQSTTTSTPSTTSQSTTSSSTSTTSSGAPAETSAFPPCVTNCQSSAALIAGCFGPRDLRCICSIKSRTLYQTEMDSCIKKGCGGDADKDVAAANQNQTSQCLAFASGLAGKSTASSTSKPSSSNAAGSIRPLAFEGARSVGIVLGTLLFGAVVGATAL